MSKTPVRHVQHKPIGGADLVARFLVVEATMIAIGRRYVASHPIGERDAIVASIRSAAQAELDETGHPLAQEHGARHLDEMMQEISGE